MLTSTFQFLWPASLLLANTEANRYREFKFLLIDCKGVASKWVPYYHKVDISVRERRGFPDITTATDVYLYWKTGYRYRAAHLVYWIWKRRSKCHLKLIEKCKPVCMKYKKAFLCIKKIKNRNRRSDVKVLKAMTSTNKAFSSLSWRQQSIHVCGVTTKVRSKLWGCVMQLVNQQRRIWSVPKFWKLSLKEE